MGSALLTALIFLLMPLLLLAVLGGLVLALLRILGVKGGARQRQDLEDETKLIQEIYRGLTKMEQRIEALETILLETERKEDDERRV